ncbi:MAG: 7-cyano-7-deazaguanine synthase QueC [bacterium]|nr:7-cyano-7-deazaguanine synthase QueC [bacterium]
MTLETKKTVLIFSGGLDSTTLLYYLIDQGHELKTLSVNYGQRHVRELDAAARISEGLGIEHRIADLRSISPLLAGNSLVGSEMAVPEGHYAEESMKQTVVPNRNMIMLSVAIGWAISLKFQAVAYGAHSGDHAIYPDCRPEFAETMAAAARLCDWSEIELLRPFVSLSKGDIAKIGSDLNAPFDLTWTCYNGRERHCGKCGACVERKEAFAEHGLHDPVEFE